MREGITKTKETYGSLQVLLLFLGYLIGFSSLAYAGILLLNPTSIFVGALMISPALATFSTLYTIKRPLSSLPWRLKSARSLVSAYMLPLLYISVSYALLWSLGLGDFINLETIDEWSDELGMDSFAKGTVVSVMILLLLTVGVVKNMGAVLGEEIGWRGFLLFELRKILSFRVATLLSGLIWAIWHYPLIFLIYGNSELLVAHISAFTLMIVSMSVIMGYITFRSNSLWPAAIFHSIHNIYIQKICTPLTIPNENSAFWMDEFGWMIAIVSLALASFFWRKAKRENL